MELPRLEATEDSFVKYIIYLIVGVVVALVALRLFNARKPPRE